MWSRKSISILKTRIPDTEVIENPVSDAFFEQEKREKGRLIFYPAVFQSLKNQYNLIKALYRLKKDNVNFHCVLPGTIIDYAYLMNYNKKINPDLNLEEDVTIPGPVPFESDAQIIF